MSSTPEQTTAIQTIDRALLVEAGAGTGKTWVLVQRFLYLLEQHPDWPVSGIIAITFTEKAAREMRTRIRQALEQRAAQAPADPLWQARRHELEQLQVSTIHGLCARILRENAIAAGLDPRFEVLDEAQADILKETAVGQALAELARPGADPDSAILELLASLQLLDLRDQLADLLRKRGTVERMFAELPGTAELLARWEQGAAEMRAELWQEAMRENAGFHAAIENLPEVAISDPTDRLVPAVELGQQGCRLAQAGQLAAACAAWAQISLSGGKQGAWGGTEALKDLKEDLGQLRDLGKKWQKSGRMQEPGEADRRSATALQGWKALWQAVSTVYQRLKAEQYALDFDDLELLTGQLLAQQPRPERLQAFAEGICHLMVDEFQDTNAAQQQIVYALAHPADGGRLFVVGDAKQSIYRFRQAQVAVFNRTARDIHLATGHPPVPLSRSFRTHAALVTALNDLFTQVLRPLGNGYQDFEARPSGLQPQRPSQPGQAPVEVLLVPRQTAAGESVLTEDARIFEARRLAEKLLRLQAEGYPVWDRDAGAYRPFRFKDAAILFRSTTSLPLYEEQFKATGLPYLTVSGRGYYDRPEVRDLLALLTCLHNQADDLALAAALRSPLFNLSDETLFALRRRVPDATGRSAPSDHAVPLLQALRNPPPTAQAGAVAFTAALLEELLGLTGRVQVWQLLRTTLDRTGYEAALALSDRERGSGGRQLSNVHKFLGLARQDGSANLSQFLSGLADLRASEAREGEGLADAPESGAVQLMSIHAAKGLEFPVVVVADLGRKPGRAGSPERVMHDPAFGLVCMVRDENGDWQEPVCCAWARWLNERMEAAENKRLLYVACTRAADLLILSGQPGNAGSWLETLQQTWGISEDGPEQDCLEREGFSLRIERPAYAEEEAQRAPIAAPSAAPAELASIPPLALPLPALNRVLPIPVTRLEQLLAAEDDETGGAQYDEPALRPLVREAAARAGYVPAYLVGRVIHRILEDWDCLQLPEAVLARRIEAFARREGIRTEAALADTLRRSGRILADLRASELYSEICAAPHRYSEIPFTLTSQLGLLHGVIDLLYEDRQGRWHLVDWKSEYVPYAQLPAHAAQHTLQVAVYAEAARAALGQLPQAAVCFLAARARVWHYAPADLQEALQRLSA